MQELPLEISAEEAQEETCSQFPIFDIRGAEFRSLGAPPGVRVISADELLRRSRQDPDFAAAGGLVMCVKGMMSLKAVQQLREAGFDRFSSLQGGFEAWQARGLPVVTEIDLDESERERYARHLVMPQVGVEGQKKLLASRVLLLGLGGLNSPAALYLAAAGVGTLGLLDHDRVEVSNLQRQVLHTQADIGRSKTESAQAQLAALNPTVKTEVLDVRLAGNNAEEIIADWDLVIDGTDNFGARYAVNRACIKLGKPLVYGAVMRFQGQVSLFDNASGGPCFRCFLPEPPDRNAAPSCAEAGVLGVMPGLIGTLQATEAIKYLLGLGRSLNGRLLLVDTLGMDFRTMTIRRNEECPDCSGPIRN